MTLTDSIVWEATKTGTTDIDNDNTATMTVTYSDIESGYIGYGNIEKDPMFEAESNYDLHLLAGSPCIGQGIAISGVKVDLDEDSRPNPPAIGAYEPGG